ncbi:UBP-type zinc finger domain-containing protein [Streptomyces sp. NPDC086010]|uniref:UBP-type zinc finger domain-containing protein n=1 Tax=Streptomyces sp. NPDC086010 TaxID=3365745 RepID=UPI0037CD2412
MSHQHIPGINPQAAPSGEGCADCLHGDGPGWWFHLRRCAECGHIGCCDTSPSQHGTKHFQETGHAVVTSFEPGEDWYYNFETQAVFDGPPLASPTSHPTEQPVPGPAGSVPSEWQQRLN